MGTVRASRRRALARQKEAAHAAWLEAIRSERVAYLRYAAADEALWEAETRDEGVDGLHSQQARKEAEMIFAAGYEAGAEDESLGRWRSPEAFAEWWKAGEL